LSFDIKQDQLCNNGTTVLDVPEFLILNFYRKLEEDYKLGLLTQIEILLKERHYDFYELNPEKLLFIILENHLVRFPVEIFKSNDLSILNGYVFNTNTTNQCLKMIQLGERFACEYDFVERINHIYIEKYKSQTFHTYT
jgi:hypothetical protein